MGTYDPRTLLADWGNERMTADMAIGHILQHIVNLYELQVPNHKRRPLTVPSESEMTQLQMQVDRLQQLVDSLTGLNLTVYQLQSDVDTLRAHLAKDNGS